MASWSNERRLQTDVGQQLAGPLAHLALLAADPRRAHDRPQQPGVHPRVAADHDVLDRGHGAEQADVLERPGDPQAGDHVRARRG